MELGPNQLKWIAALKSGEYKQGRSYLHREINGEPQFCCLGVACDLFFHGIIHKWDSEREGEVHVEYDGRSSYPPDSVVEDLGLHGITGRAKKEDGTPHTVSLTKRNDNGESFEHIAKILEEKPELYFKESK